MFIYSSYINALRIIVSCLCFVACENVQRQSNNIVSDSTGMRPVLEAKPQIDTALFVAIQDSLLYGAKEMELLTVHRLNDSITYCILRLSDNSICTAYFLGVQKNKFIASIDTIARECDDDLSQPSYTYSSYTYDSLNHSIITTTVTESAKEKYLVREGQFLRFKDGYDREKTENITDSVVTIRLIDAEGRVSLTKKSTSSAP